MRLSSLAARALATSGAALALTLALPAAATDIGVSIGVSQPGVYGRIDIGRFPQPQVVVQRPVVVVQQPQLPPPVYMHVPPGHRKKWSKHCAKYGACGTPVYFVQDGWYQRHVMQGTPHPGHRHAAPVAEYRDHGRDERDERGHGNGHGHGHGHGKKHGGKD